MNLFYTNLILVGTIIILAVISPGPDFAVIVRNSLTYGRKTGFATALGIAAGVTIHTTYTILGLSYFISRYVWFLEAVRFAGAFYLIYLGASAFFPTKKGAEDNENFSAEKSVTLWEAFKNGFLCNVMNPKTILFFTALFTQVISPDTQGAIKVSIGVLISLTHLFWFSFVVWILTDSRTVKLFERWQKHLEKFVGFFLLALGAKLALSD
jgi:RhtB (resistance to homoserine/threonine) family protein